MLRHIDDGMIFENFDEERRRLDRRGDRIAIVVVERAPNRRRKRLVYEIFSSRGIERHRGDGGLRECQVRLHSNHFVHVIGHAAEKFRRFGDVLTERFRTVRRVTVECLARRRFLVHDARTYGVPRRLFRHAALVFVLVVRIQLGAIRLVLAIKHNSVV